MRHIFVRLVSLPVNISLLPFIKRFIGYANILINFLIIAIHRAKTATKNINLIVLIFYFALKYIISNI